MRREESGGACQHAGGEGGGERETRSSRSWGAAGREKERRHVEGGERQKERKSPRMSHVGGRERESALALPPPGLPYANWA